MYTLLYLEIAVLIVYWYDLDSAALIMQYDIIIAFIIVHDPIKVNKVFCADLPYNST